MSTETRKVFDIEAQKGKDLLAAIKTITPVISLISEWGKAEKEHNKLCGELKKISKEIKTIKDALKILSGDQVIEALQKAQKEKCELHNQIYTKAEELKQTCNEFKSEVIVYMSYVKLFEKWIDKDILERSVLPKLKTKKEYLSILFLGYHATGDESRAVLSIKAHLARHNFNGDVLQNGWNYMLDYLKNN